MAKNFFSVLVFLECLEEYSKKNFRFLHIFATKSYSKVPASATLNEDDREFARSGSRTGHDVTSGIVDSSVQCLIVKKNYVKTLFTHSRIILVKDTDKV